MNPAAFSFKIAKLNSIQYALSSQNHWRMTGNEHRSIVQAMKVGQLFKIEVSLRQFKGCIRCSPLCFLGTDTYFTELI